jgi:hypothetical protein
MTAGASRKNGVLIGVAGLWLTAVSAGMGVLLQYASTPGDSGGPPSRWPVDTGLTRPKGRPVLIMMAHPHCPCTRASLEELSRLMSRNLDRVDARVVFFAPRGADEDWWMTDLWTGASAIPGVAVVLDRDGAESRRFHAETSGQSLLYDADGSLLFSGGMTVARGHEGDNAGLGALETLIGGGTTATRRTPVFGCALHDWNSLSSGAERPWKR